MPKNDRDDSEPKKAPKDPLDTRWVEPSEMLIFLAVGVGMTREEARREISRHIAEKN